MKKVKISVVHLKESLSYIPKGETIEFRKDPLNAYDPLAIKATWNGKDIGFVSASAGTSAVGCFLNNEIYHSVESVFSGTVVDYSTLTRKVSKDILVVEIKINEDGSLKTDDEACKILKLKLKGSKTTYPKKEEVIEEFSNDNKVFVDLKFENGKIIALKDNEKAGVVEERELTGTSSLADIDLLKLILENENIEAKVSKVEKTSYFVEVAISNDKLESMKVEATKKVMDTKKEELITLGFDVELLNDIEDYLLSNNFTADDIQCIFNTYKKYPSEVAWRIPQKPKTMFKDSFGGLETGFTAILNKFHLLCSGEKGTGKNVFIETFAYIFQRPLYTISINRESDKYDLVGSKTIDIETNEDGVVENKVKFSPEVLLESMEVGGILNIDEINFADPGVTGLLHSICDDRRAIEVPGYKYVEADDNFVMMATMNLNYQGTNELNEALQDRFVDILFPNNNSILDVLVDKCKDIDKSQLKLANKVYEKMVSIVRDRDGQLDDNCITVRGFIQGCMMSKRLGLKKALEVCVANKIKDSEYRQNVLTIIENFI